MNILKAISLLAIVMLMAGCVETHETTSDINISNNITIYLNSSNIIPTLNDMPYNSKIKEEIISVNHSQKYFIINSPDHDHVEYVVDIYPTNEISKSQFNEHKKRVMQDFRVTDLNFGDESYSTKHGYFINIFMRKNNACIIVKTDGDNINTYIKLLKI